MYDVVVGVGIYQVVVGIAILITGKFPLEVLGAASEAVMRLMDGGSGAQRMARVGDRVAWCWYGSDLLSQLLTVLLPVVKWALFYALLKADS